MEIPRNANVVLCVHLECSSPGTGPYTFSALVTVPRRLDTGRGYTSLHGPLQCWVTCDSLSYSCVSPSLDPASCVPTAQH